MTPRLICVITLLTAALAMMQAASAAAQTPSERATSIGASVYFEVPSFGHLSVYGDDRLRGVSPGLSVQVHRALTNQVRVGVEMDFATAHVWRGLMPTSVGEDGVVDLPAVQSFRFTTFSPVLSFKVGSTSRWEFVVNGGLVFAHVETGGATTELPASSAARAGSDQRVLHGRLHQRVQCGFSCHAEPDIRRRHARRIRELRSQRTCSWPVDSPRSGSPVQLLAPFQLIPPRGAVLRVAPAVGVKVSAHWRNKLEQR